MKEDISLSLSLEEPEKKGENELTKKEDGKDKTLLGLIPRR